jgi:hypothetical protein
MDFKLIYRTVNEMLLRLHSNSGKLLKFATSFIDEANSDSVLLFNNSAELAKTLCARKFDSIILTFSLPMEFALLRKGSMFYDIMQYLCVLVEKTGIYDIIIISDEVPESRILDDEVIKLYQFIVTYIVNFVMRAALINIILLRKKHGGEAFALRLHDVQEKYIQDKAVCETVYKSAASLPEERFAATTLLQQHLSKIRKTMVVSDSTLPFLSNIRNYSTVSSRGASETEHTYCILRSPVAAIINSKQWTKLMAANQFLDGKTDIFADFLFKSIMYIYMDQETNIAVFDESDFAVQFDIQQQYGSDNGLVFSETVYNKIMQVNPKCASVLWIANYISNNCRPNLRALTPCNSAAEYIFIHLKGMVCDDDGHIVFTV